MKQTRSKRRTEVKRLLKTRQRELESQEAQIFLKFAEVYPQADLTLPVAEAVWAFIFFLKKSGYHIINGRTVFCFPFSHIVKLKNLK